MKKKLFLLIGLMAQVFITFSQETRELARYKPISVIDLRTTEGTQLVDGKWTYKVGKIQPVKFNSPGPSKTDNLNLYPTGTSIETQNLFPNVKDSTFSSKNWTSILPTELEERKGNGRLSFVWYRVNLSIPASINNAKIDGKAIYFEVTADDYTEMYINGMLKKGFGQTGAGVVSGYNARNRVILTSDAKAGEKFEISILVANGPFGDEPDNYVWIRNAVLDIYSPEEIASQNPKIGTLNKIENAFDEIIAPNTKAEKLADGFSFTEGPVWHPDGFLLFSDPNMNMIYRFNPKNNNVTIFQSHSGYTGTDIGNLGQPGSNGLAIDNEGRLIVCQHGNRRVIRHETKGPITILADKIDGKRLNSPNDIVLKSDGTVYFTDPPYGLEKHYSDSKKELQYQGVFMVKDGKVKLVATDCGGPNGIAFSPDEKYLYVSNWDIRDIHHTKTIWKYEVQADGTLKNGKIFYSFNYTDGDEALDGLKVDVKGNVFSSAPGGVYIISEAGILLGNISCPERPANMAWGDEDGKTLYLTAHSSLLRIRTLTGGKIAKKQ